MPGKDRHSWPYYALHSTLNSIGERCFKKKKVNPDAPDFTHQDFTPRATSMSDISDSDNINYPEVPYVHQPRVNDCMDSCVNMLVQFHEENHQRADNPDSISEMLTELKTSFEQRDEKLFGGKSIDDITRYSPEIGHHPDIPKESFDIKCLISYLWNYGPLITIVKTHWVVRHAIVIKGVVDNKVIFHDPWKGPDRVWDFEKFKNRWYGDLLFVNNGYNKKFDTKSVQTEVTDTRQLRRS